MSFPRFRLVQGKAIGDRSTPTSSNGISTPEPVPQHVVKQELLNVENYPDSIPIKTEPPTIKLEDPTSPPQMMGGTPQGQHSMQRSMQQLQFQSPMGGSVGTSEDKNVIKCVRFLKTLINLSNNEDPDQPDKALRVKELIRGVIYMDTPAEDFTRNLQAVLKSQAQPHLLPFLQNTLPALRAAVRNGEASVEGVSPPPGYVFNNGRAPPPPLPQQQQQLDMRPVVAPPTSQPGLHPSQQIISRLTADPQMQNRPPPPQMMGGPRPGVPGGHVPVQMGQQRPPMGMGGQMPPPPPMGMGQQMQMQPQMPPQQPQQPQQPPQPQNDSRMEVDEPPRMRQYPEGSLKASILRPDEILNRITKRMMSSCSVEEEALVAISDAVESHLREMITQMAGIAEHRVESMRIADNCVAIDDVKRQLRFLEDLDRQEEELRESREKESLIRMSKNKNSGKETIEKAKEMQRQDAEAKRNRDANAAAIAALSSNRSAPKKWEGSAPSTAPPRPRTVRVTTRDLHMLVNTDNRFNGTFIREKLSYGGPATDTSI